LRRGTGRGREKPPCHRIACQSVCDLPTPWFRFSPNVTTADRGVGETGGDIAKMVLKGERVDYFGRCGPWLRPRRWRPVERRLLAQLVQCGYRDAKERGERRKERKKSIVSMRRGPPLTAMYCCASFFLCQSVCARVPGLGNQKMDEVGGGGKEEKKGKKNSIRRPASGRVRTSRGPSFGRLRQDLVPFCRSGGTSDAPVKGKEGGGKRKGKKKWLFSA